MEPLTPAELSSYFSRVKLPVMRQSVTPDLQLLCKLHLAHVQQVPYENLSLHLEKVSHDCSKHRCAHKLRHGLCAPPRMAKTS